MEYKHICQWCEKEFVSKRKNHTFCSSKCSVSSQSRNKYLKQIEDNKEIYKEIASRKIVNECIAENKYKYCINGVYAQSLSDYYYHKNHIHICASCGIKFIFREYINLKENVGKYCSEQCMFESLRNKVKVICKNCHKQFEMNEHDIPYNVFCSDNCEQEFYENIDNKHLTKREKIKLKCINCGKNFYPIEPTTSLKYCSYKCKMEFQKKKFLEEHICKNCNKKFIARNKRTFCSRKCASEYTAKQIGLGTKIREHHNGLKGRKQTEHAKQLMSKNISRAIRSGKMNGSPFKNFLSGYVNFIPHNFRSGWEFNFAIILLHLKRDYRYESKTFKLKDGKRYTPDFYDVKRNIFYEIKGRNNNQQKCEILQQEHPNIKIHFIDYKKYLRIYNHFTKKLKLVYSVTGGEKGFYSVDDIKQMFISKEEHNKLFVDNKYKKWDEKFDKRNNI